MGAIYRYYDPKARTAASAARWWVGSSSSPKMAHYTQQHTQTSGDTDSCCGVTSHDLWLELDQKNGPDGLWFVIGVVRRDARRLRAGVTTIERQPQAKWATSPEAAHTRTRRRYVQILQHAASLAQFPP
jgi:hypothetical protein